MNRTDRLLAILLELQARGKQRAEDLATTFETSKRTIYRDIEALCEAGVPIVAVPGRGYSLLPGYFLPPLRFSPTEATMLLLGSEFVAQHFDAQYRTAAETAARKIEAVLAPNLREEVAYLQGSIRFVHLGGGTEPADPTLLPQLRRAIIERHTVRFRYHARFDAAGQPTVGPREADPYGLVHSGETWYLIAYCHLRQAMRNFRLDRVDRLEILPSTFTRPPGYRLQDRRPDESRNLVIRALFDPVVARWVQEARFFYIAAQEETADGLLVTLQVRHEQEVLGWLLGWGRHVTVLEPESLRRQMAAEAEGILQKHAAPAALLT